MNNKTIYQLLSEYTKEEIDKVIETLDSKDKNLLYLRYGHDLSNPDSSNWKKDYNHEFYKKLLPKLRRRLEKIHEGKKVPLKINGLLTIYQLLSNYSKEEIDFVISKLNNHDKYLLYLRYGCDLENPDSSNWKQDYNYQFYGTLLHKMRRFLKVIREGKTLAQGGKVIKTIYQEFKDYTKEEVDYIISLLPDDDKHILYLKYGQDLENPDISNWEFKYGKKVFVIIKKIRLRLEKNREGKKVPFKINGLLTIYQILRYGNDLSNPNSSNWSMDYHIEFYKKLLPKLRRRLEKNREGKKVPFKINGLSTIYQILNKYSKEEIDLVIENLSSEDKHLLWLRYGDDLSNPIRNPNWNMDYYTEFYKILLPKIKRRLENNKQALKGKKETLEIKSNNPYLLKIVKETLEKLKDEKYNNILEKYTIKEILSYVLIQKMDGDYNMKDITRLFGLDRKMIISMATKVLHNVLEEKDKVKTKSVN